MEAKKFNELEILTTEVYLNIEHANGLVNTMMLKTEEALEKYGDLEVISVGEPRYHEDHHHEAEGSDSSGAEQPAAKSGVTDVILRAIDDASSAD